jgi:hypothetical protein
LYCIKIFRKRKVPFSTFFTANFSEFVDHVQKQPKTPPNRGQKPPQSPRERVQRDGAQVQKRCAGRQEPERGAERGRKQKKQPRLSAPEVERFAEQREQGDQKKQAVERDVQMPRPAAQRAQNIIHRAERKPNCDSQRKLRRLRGDRLRHQPNSRAKNPPPGASSS